MRWFSLPLVLCFALGMSAPGPALAEAPHKEEGEAKPKEEHKDAKAHGKAHEHENINLFKGWLDLTVWTIAVFLILFLVLGTFAWPQIRSGLDARERAIAQDKAEAVTAKREADALRAGLDAERARAADEVRQMMDKARTDAQATAAAEIARGKAEVASEKERLNRELAREREQMLQDVYSQGAGLAALISAKAIGKSLSEQDHRELLAQALDEFKGASRGLKEAQGANA